MATTTKLFGVFDKVSNRLYTVGACSTAGAFARDIGKMLIRVNPNFEDEMFICELASLDEDSRHVTAGNFDMISWDVYKRPEAPAVKMENPDLGAIPFPSPKEEK